MKNKILRTISMLCVLFLIGGLMGGCKSTIQTVSEIVEWVDVSDTSGSDNTNTDSNGSDTTTSNGNTITSNGNTITSNGNTTTSNGNTITSNGNTTTSKGNTTTSNSNTDIPDKLSNPKIKLINWFEFPLSDKNDPFTRAYNNYIKKYGKDTIDLVTVAGEDAYKQRLAAMISGNDSPELIHVKTDWMPQYAINSFSMAVDNVLDTSTLPYQGMVKEMKYKGKNYIAACDGFYGNFVWYNKTLFKKMGVKTPKEYYDAGDWTWANFQKTAKSMTSGSVWGFAAENFRVLTESSVDAQIVKYDESQGKFSVNWKSNICQAAIRLTQTMIHTDKSWNPDLTFSALQFKNKKVAMSYGNIQFAMNQKGLTDELEFVPLPVQNKGETPIIGGFGIFWSIGNNSKNKEAAIVFAKLLRQEQEADYKDNVKNTAERYLSDEQVLMARQLSEQGHCYQANRLPTWVAQYNYGFWDRVGVKNKPIATIIDEYNSLMTDIINSMNK